jgi:hypothetical protein
MFDESSSCGRRESGSSVQLPVYPKIFGYTRSLIFHVDLACRDIKRNPSKTKATVSTGTRNHHQNGSSIATTSPSLHSGSMASSSITSQCS